jgi:hypothetical protein
MASLCSRHSPTKAKRLRGRREVVSERSYDFPGRARGEYPVPIAAIRQCFARTVADWLPHLNLNRPQAQRTGVLGRLLKVGSGSVGKQQRSGRGRVEPERLSVAA